MNPTEQTDPPLSSDQSGPHEDLAVVVNRHLKTPWQRPIPAHTEAAAKTLLQWLNKQGKPLLLDSFCGTGMSTALLAARHPDCAVVGVDKSAARLSRHQSSAIHTPEYLLIRAECEPLWRVLAEGGVVAQQQTLYYPNPWPKRSQLKRRIHGHPGFLWLLKLGGHIEMRTNWSIYAEEFAAAMQTAGWQGSAQSFVPDQPLTLFERKYQERSQTLWRWCGQSSGVANTHGLG